MPAIVFPDPNVTNPFTDPNGDIWDYNFPKTRWARRPAPLAAVANGIQGPEGPQGPAGADGSDATVNATNVAAVIDAATEHTTLADSDRFALTVGGSLRWLSASRIASYIVGVGRTLAGAWAFSSTTRPTSAGTGTPASNSLMTRADIMELLGSPSYYVMREDWENSNLWHVYATGSAGQGLSYAAQTTGITRLQTGATINSTCSLYRGAGANINPVLMKPWVWQDRSMIEGSVADVLVRIGFSGSTAEFTTVHDFTGFEYDSAVSPNWRFYDSANGTYTDTGVAAVADTWVTFKMRSNGNDNQIVWSINGGSETTRTGARDYVLSFAQLIYNRAASAKTLMKDFTSFIGYPTR